MISENYFLSSGFAESETQAKIVAVLFIIEFLRQSYQKQNEIL
jgi:hypothetical protein